MTSGTLCAQPGYRFSGSHKRSGARSSLAVPFTIRRVMWRRLLQPLRLIAGSRRAMTAAAELLARSSSVHGETEGAPGVLMGTPYPF